MSAAADMPATNQVEALAAAPVMTKEMNARDLARAEKNVSGRVVVHATARVCPSITPVDKHAAILESAHAATREDEDKKPVANRAEKDKKSFHAPDHQVRCKYFKGTPGSCYHGDHCFYSLCALSSAAKRRKRRKICKMKMLEEKP